MNLVTLADVEDARKLLDGVVRNTPLEPSRPLTDQLGGPAWLKCENLQRAGSYKVRGAYVRISRLSRAERARGVVAASAGNHAQGVALAASLLGASATVFMPYGAALPKVAATKRYGADVRSAGSTVDEALVAAQEYAESTGAVLIHPFDHPDVIAGQGTVALEILEQCPDVKTIIAGVGGGGLSSGLAVAVLTGGNIDPLLMLRVIEHGLAAAGRYLRLTIRCGDRPGQLAQLLTLIGERGANVVDVAHRRHDPELNLGEVEIDVSVETRGDGHADQLIEALRATGNRVTEWINR